MFFFDHSLFEKIAKKVSPVEGFRVFLMGKNIQVGIKDEEKESFPGETWETMY